jgi:hypothetical protein
MIGVSKGKGQRVSALLTGRYEGARATASSARSVGN